MKKESDLIMDFPWPFAIKLQNHTDLVPQEVKGEIGMEILKPILFVLLFVLISTIFFMRKRSIWKKISFFYMLLSSIIHLTVEVFKEVFLKIFNKMEVD